VGLQRLTLTLAAAAIPTAEALLTLAGAQTITLHDAADDPVFEPEPSTAPLWPNVTLRALFASDAALAPLRTLLTTSFPQSTVAVDVLADSAWQLGLQQGVRARAIGTRLWLAPADDMRTPTDRIVIRVNMGLAFGTGEHPTTALCLDWLEQHVAIGDTLLDYGCGSGILALAALALGANFAFASDNDGQALMATRANAELNGAADRLFVGMPDELPGLTVDVLVANILAGPLIELAPTFERWVRPNGHLVLSGILEPQAARVAAAYAPFCRDIEQTVHAGWVRLTARRNAG
jgi:ribosomal protein L11 methyltransferase